MNTTSGGSIFLSVLKDEGVTHLFGNPGTTELPVMHALTEHPDLNYVLGLQESVVVAMADGFARASGQLAACNVHVAPGLGNAMGSIFNANWSGSPIIVSAGQQEQGHGLMEPMLYGELVPMAAPCVKWAFEVTRAEDLPRVIRRAAKIALTPPMGPVFLSLPGDVLNAQVAVEIGQRTRVETGAVPSQDTLAALADRLMTAERPLLVAGQEVASADALEDAAHLAELLGAAAMQQSVPSGAHYLSEHPTYVGGLTRVQKQVREVLSNYDVVVALGGDVFRMSVYAPVEAVPEGTRLIHIGQHDREMGKNYPAEMAVRADIKATLGALLAYIEKNRSDSQAAAADERLREIESRNWSTNRARISQTILSREAGTALDPERVMLEITDSLPADAIVVDEGLISSRQLPNLLAYRGRNDFFALDSGGIGFAIAGAVGISLAHPTRPVVAVIGDGSAMYSFQALWTAANKNLQITYVICNNASYRILKERLLAFHGNDNFVGMDMRDPAIDFTGMARSLGVWAQTVETIEEFSEMLRASYDREGPKLIDVKVADGF
ncbi:MAG: benzoylformate decarboxylase [Alphaproteobacteria bacterium]|nr:benzoylformate decarboxylase [Alphaproteobacteria bacterium]